MIKKSVLAFTAISLLNIGVTNVHAVANAQDSAYNCAKEQTYIMPPEIVALALTIGSGLIGSVTFTDEPDFGFGCFFGGLTAFTSAFIAGIKHDFADYRSANRIYYDRMMKAFGTLIAPSVLASGFCCPDEAAAPVLKGFGLLGTIATALAWL